MQYVEEGEDDALTMHPQSYAEMRYRTRDRLPKWAKRAINSVTAFFSKDPVATYILNDGPMTWYWNWLTKRCPPTHQLVNCRLATVLLPKRACFKGIRLG